MKVQYLSILTGFTVLLFLCLFGLAKDKRSIAKDVRLLLESAFIPMLGNMLIVGSSDYMVSLIGYYLYLAGTDLMFYFLMRYAMNYCSYRFKGSVIRTWTLIVTITDLLSIALNPVFHIVFTTERIYIEGFGYYYSIVSHTGHIIHLTLNYMIFAAVLFIFIKKLTSVSRIYREKFYVVFFSLIIASVWESYYVFSNKPIDTSMMGYAACGILIWFFTLRYVPIFVKNSMMNRIMGNINDAVFFFDSDEECIYINKAATDMFGVTDETRGDARRVLHEIINATETELKNDFEKKRVRIENGIKKYYNIEYHVNRDKRQRFAGAFIIVRDYTEDENENLRKRYYATHDRLTGLYNKEYFIELVRSILDADNATDYVLLVSDIKDFKLINDIYGMDVGDEILRRIAGNIEDTADENDIYCRLGNDEFAILKRVSDFENQKPENSKKRGETMDSIINYPVVIHMGAYRISDRTVPVNVMLDRAFMAISSIKSEYTRRLAFYDDALRDTRIWEQSISSALPEAIASHQIVPYLQPQYNDKGILEGAEVLVRWIHPTEGFLAPYRFIPVFEKNGMIAQVDKYMWESACRLLRKWKDEGKNLYLSVNISPKDFYFVNIYETFTELVKKYDIDPAMLHLEITETIMMTDINSKVKILEDLRKAGFIVEMDDFGSGYSSLNLLKDMPIDVLKIDMMFLRQSEEQERAKIILKSIVDMSVNLGIPSIAEGVETEEQLKMLIAMGCKLFQGYFFSKPVPVEEFEEKAAKG